MYWILQLCQLLHFQFFIFLLVLYFALCQLQNFVYSTTTLLTFIFCFNFYASFVHSLLAFEFCCSFHYVSIFIFMLVFYLCQLLSFVFCGFMVVLSFSFHLYASFVCYHCWLLSCFSFMLASELCLRQLYASFFFIRRFTVLCQPLIFILHLYASFNPFSF